MFLPTFTQNPFFPPQYGLLNGMVNPQVPAAPTIIKNYNIMLKLFEKNECKYFRQIEEWEIKLK